MKTLTLVLLFLLSALPARATPITWALQDVTLQDGGRLTGGFTYDEALGDFGLLSFNVEATGYQAPLGITPTTFSEGGLSFGSGVLGIQAINTHSASITGCYGDEYSPSNPCTVLSAFEIYLSEPLGSANNIPIASGQFRMECATFGCPPYSLGFPFNDPIVAGSICSEVPCPGGPIVNVPEPSALLSILQGLLLLIVWPIRKLFNIAVSP